MKEVDHTDTDSAVEEKLHGGQTEVEADRTPVTETHASIMDEDEDNLPELKHLKDVVKAFEINGTWLRRQLGVLAILLVGIIMYITNGYQAQQELFEEIRLKKELLDSKYRCLTRKSELTQQTRQSQIERRLKALGDSTLSPSKKPLFKITKDNH